MNIPKTFTCVKCGKKPKPQIWAFGYSDKDDEFYLKHWCNSENKEVYFPKLNGNPFTRFYVNRQRPLVIEAWNTKQTYEGLISK